MFTKENEKKAGFVIVGLLLLFWGTVNVCSNFNEFRAQEEPAAIFSTIAAMILFGLGPAALGIFFVLRGMAPKKPQVASQAAEGQEAVFVAKPGKPKKRKKKKK